MSGRGRRSTVRIDHRDDGQASYEDEATDGDVESEMFVKNEESEDRGLQWFGEAQCSCGRSELG